VFRILVILCLLLLASCDEMGGPFHMGSRFANRADAEETIAKGWIPKAIPPEASEISEEHELDSNTGHGGFRFSETDAVQLRRDLVRVIEEPNTCKVPWKEMLADGHEWFKTEYFLVAVNWENSWASFWICYGRGV